MSKASYQDPVPLNASEYSLPQSWSDQFCLKNPWHIIRVLKSIFETKRNRVILPDDLMGKEIIPKYAQQEFHNLPNGNYSNILANGYVRGFDVVMLGEMKKIRHYAARKLCFAKSVLDLGTGGGAMAASVYKEGVEDVWGVDVSPYLLQAAIKRHPDVSFVHAKAESLPFDNGRFDALSSCYLLHEVPPKYIYQILDEIKRVLKPDGECVFIEPSKLHYQVGLFEALRKYGFKGLYFRWLSHFVYEPFVKSWHKLDFKTLLLSRGFEVIEEMIGVPNTLWHARKVKE
ncbi:class I SAM-dependent methyltransferase [Fangia hongkongensis]|uniref:class I SAM-dependent methyltransferase n=1 Tax=Fangia hongkongensis TaxID=270495 RepID=UPI0003669DF5|nr:class I SAM-dependent methyltransferase [Fangia hongkongensis]MBK2125962.1 class I SAM-dependent methyltransferase [Fangia hongkongensis]